MEDALTRSRKASFPAILDLLTSDELKAICSAHELEDAGSAKGVLIDCIIGRQPTTDLGGAETVPSGARGGSSGADRDGLPNGAAHNRGRPGKRPVPPQKQRLFAERIFRLEKDIQLRVPQVLRFENVNLSFRPEPPEGHAEDGRLAHPCLVVATADRTVNSRVSAALADLAEKRMPKGSKVWREEHRDQKPVDIGPGDRFLGVAPLASLPAGAADALVSLSRRIGSALFRATTTLRWRSGSHVVQGHRGAGGLLMEFSLGKNTEFKVQSSFQVTWEERSPLSLTTSLAEATQALLSEDQSEPVAHELWREAWEVRRSAPRSAIVLAVAAAEVGLKSLVASLVPEAAWLVENVASPDLVTMLREFLPGLPLKNEYDPALIADEALTAMKKAVFERNKVVHRGKIASGARALEILLIVRRLLFVYDYYAGEDWALERLADQPAAGRPTPA